MKRRMFCLLIGMGLTFYCGCSSRQHAPTAPIAPTVPTTRPIAKSGKWESEIAAFEKKDLQTPPPEHPILFVGSSTIRIWKTSAAFPGLPVLNRGFGGSEISDVLQYFDRVVARYHPSTIVFYSGDNDMAAGKSAAQVVQDMRQFIDRVRTELPGTKLIVIAIKPSIARWKLMDQMREANRQIQTLVAAYPGGTFVNCESKILGADGKPRADLFRVDGLHLNDKGYEILDAQIKPLLAK